MAKFPNHPQYDGEELHEWATYMARQLALHIANQPYVKPLHATKATAWELPSDRCEAKLGQNPMKMVSNMTIASGVLNGIVHVVTTWSKGGDPTIGIGTLIEPNVVAVCGHLLRGKNGYAVQVEITAGNGHKAMGDYAVVPENWDVRLDKRRENDAGMIHLQKSIQGVHPIDYMSTPFTDSCPGRSMLGSVYGFPEEFPHLCVSEMRIQFSLTHDTKLVRHNGDTKEGNSGGPVVDINGRLVAVHGGWEWANKKKTEKINVSAPVNRMGNDFDVFREILAFMAVNPSNLLKVGAKFLAPKAGGITEVTAGQRSRGPVPKIVFEWH
ncbi:trypsin-like cysteine/serine peptidase domain-containing protein [Annulohypoxylon stygium]|nr:trypsin-like cysteine/serine peptidase domain-containing protein [Annulohypoxylon stygium]